MSNDVELNNRKLNQIIKAFSAPYPSVRVGILGDKNAREESGTTNAQVGAAHEYGTSKLPQRSFLRIPITEKLDKYLKDSMAFSEEVLADIVKEGSLNQWIKMVGAVAETVVQGAFDTAGFGKWKPSDMTHKENHQTLVETQQLRNAISSEVK